MLCSFSAMTAHMTMAASGMCQPLEKSNTVNLNWHGVKPCTYDAEPAVETSALPWQVACGVACAPEYIGVC